MDKEVGEPLLDYDLDDGMDGGQEYREIEIREQDRYLPIANIARIMKRVLPGNAKIAKDAKESIQACVSEYISFITSEASDKCQLEKRKTINGDDLLWAMGALGFDQYGEPLRIYLAKYRESVKGEKPDKSKVALIKALPGQNKVPRLSGTGIGGSLPLYDPNNIADFGGDFSHLAMPYDLANGLPGVAGHGGSVMSNDVGGGGPGIAEVGQKRTRSSSSLGSAKRRAGAPEPLLDEKTGLYVTPAYTATDENGIMLQYPSVTTDVEGNIVAVTSEQQQYVDTDSGLRYEYHTQYQLDESGQVDYSKPMVVIPLASCSNSNSKSNSSSGNKGVDSAGAGASAVMNANANVNVNATSTKTGDATVGTSVDDAYGGHTQVGTPFVMLPDGLIGVLNSSDSAQVGSLEINGVPIGGVDGVEVGVLVNLVSGVVAEQQKGAMSAQLGLKVEVEQPASSKFEA